MILNPNSTTQSAELLREILPPLFAIERLRLFAQFTQYPGHAEEMVKGLTRADYDLIILLGGDGTVNEAVNGLLGSAETDNPAPDTLPKLAVIPTGSANVLVRALGFSADPVEAAHVLSRLINKDISRTISLGTWNDRWFGVNAGFGLDADVLAKVDRVREKGFAATPFRYLSIGSRAFLRARKSPPKINATATSFEGEEFSITEAPVLLASNTNPWTFLGPLPVGTNPENSFDDGLSLFGVTDLSGLGGLVGVLHLFGADPKRVLNKFTNARTIEFDHASSVKLSCPSPHRFQADGESEGKHTVVELRAVPDAVEIYAPRQARAPHERGIREIVRDFIRVF
ncbi:diacylglycerol/lipid kinase family protein [Corynebacterium sp. L4756]|uniref:diacylglycerol/lipid kinase family protein n=1 Tax=unclassified Corynebacterium TaxID=2624378 RepID=UPI00374DD44D